MELREREAAAPAAGEARAALGAVLTDLMNLRRAVLAAEDSAFFDHEGIDVAEIKKSIQTSIERGSSLRGASTITQQLAKNLYLSPSRDPLRKVRELMITWRLEAALSKARIFEIYLNVIEWGDLVWGAEAAARTYFGVPASALSREQAALLAGAIINPRVYSPAQSARPAPAPAADHPGAHARLRAAGRVPATAPVVEPEPPAEEVPPPEDAPPSPTVIDGDEGDQPCRARAAPARTAGMSKSVKTC